MIKTTFLAFKNLCKTSRGTIATSGYYKIEIMIPPESQVVQIVLQCHGPQTYHLQRHTSSPCLQTIQCHLDLQELVKGWHLLLAKQAVHIQHVLPYS